MSDDEMNIDDGKHRLWIYPRLFNRFIPSVAAGGAVRRRGRGFQTSAGAPYRTSLLNLKAEGFLVVKETIQESLRNQNTNALNPRRTGTREPRAVSTTIRHKFTLHPTILKLTIYLSHDLTL